MNQGTLTAVEINNIRLSVTDLDAYVYFRNSDQEPEALMQRLRKEEPPSPAMATGRALHKALENAEPGTFTALEADGLLFHVLGSVELELPEIRELKAETPIWINPNLGITLVGKVDAMHGQTIYDHKTTSRFDAERLFDTYQWRYYLEMFKADVFQWNCFELNQVGLNEYEVFGFHKLRQHRYIGMANDCGRLLSEFLEFLGVSKMTFPRPDCTLAQLLKANG